MRTPHDYIINTTTSDPPYTIRLKVEENFIYFELDTGSCLTLISENDFKKYLPNAQLKTIGMIVETYEGTVVPILGEVIVKVEFQGKTSMLRAVVVKGEKKALLEREWINLLKIDYFAVNQIPSEIAIAEFLKEHQVLFNDTAEPIKGFTFSMNIGDVSPIFHKARPVPFAIRTVPFAIRTVILRFLDTAAYPLPTQQDLFAILANGEIFLKIRFEQRLPATRGGNEHPAILTINTHKGLFRFRRMPFGLANALSYFQSVMDRVLAGIEGWPEYSFLIISTNQHNFAWKKPSTLCFIPLLYEHGEVFLVESFLLIYTYGLKSFADVSDGSYFLFPKSYPDFSLGSSHGCTRCGNSNNHDWKNCPAMNSYCSKCKKKGHYAKDNSKKWIVPIKVNNRQINFKIDTGADVNVLPLQNYYQSFQRIKLEKSDKILQGPNGIPLETVGMIHVKLQNKGQHLNSKIYIVDKLKQPLLSGETSEKLNTVRMIQQFSSGGRGGQRGRLGSGDNRGCYNCGEEGHRKFECTKPARGGGRGRGQSRDGGSNNTCYNCGEVGHRKYECTNNMAEDGGQEENQRKSKKACYTCGEFGHKKDDCPKSGTQESGDEEESSDNEEEETPQKRKQAEDSEEEEVEAEEPPKKKSKKPKSKKKEEDCYLTLQAHRTMPLESARSREMRRPPLRHQPGSQGDARMTRSKRPRRIALHQRPHLQEMEGCRGTTKTRIQRRASLQCQPCIQDMEGQSRYLEVHLIKFQCGNLRNPIAFKFPQYIWKRNEVWYIQNFIYGTYLHYVHHYCCGASEYRKLKASPGPSSGQQRLRQGIANLGYKMFTSLLGSFGEKRPNNMPNRGRSESLPIETARQQRDSGLVDQNGGISGKSSRSPILKPVMKDPSQEETHQEIGDLLQDIFACSGKMV
ncbi:K02A2.6-like [Cordylochernes scorpioides]|uniref:K02A2.6-like n=1 Tax=Cordylochernes scorpioides TaxID=51811 RepID=A0ABY6K8N6_9ARAC|nr:K02A2.6-like [Cordylochernes scorpioides]